MLKKEIQISTELEDIITAMKSPIGIISTSVIDGVTTIVTNSVTIFDNLCAVVLLTAEMIVTIGDTNYAVFNIINTPGVKSFDVTGIGITSEEWNVAANFRTGTRTEINEILSQQRTDDNRRKRWPLIWYIYSDNRDKTNEKIDFSSTLNIAFAYNSNDTDKTSTRIDNSISPVLQPLLSLFLLWIQSSDFYYMFEFGGFGKALDLKTKNFPFYGASDKLENVLETSTDAIEIEIELNFKKQTAVFPSSKAEFKLIGGGNFKLI